MNGLAEKVTAQAVWRAEGIDDTARLAGLLASWSGPGTVIALDGDLGAGKTFFSQSFAKAIGVKDIVNSPTFTIIKEYEGESMPFYHMDVYRLSQAEADELGLDDYFFGTGVTIVEWASLIPDLLPEARLALELEHDGGDARTIRITGYGKPYAAWCERLAALGEGGGTGA